MQYYWNMKTLLIEAFGPLLVAFYLFVAVYGTRRLLHQFRNRLTPEQRQAARDSFRNRLVHGSPSEVEQGIGAFLPRRLIALYEDHKTILTEQIEIRRPAANPENPAEPQNPAEWIEAFLPLEASPPLEASLLLYVFLPPLGVPRLCASVQLDVFLLPSVALP